MTPTERIIRWREAYEALHGRAAPRVTYSHGWFSIHHGGWTSKKRASDIDVMTARLLKQDEQ